MSAPVRICSVSSRGKKGGYFRAQPALLFAQAFKGNCTERNVVSSSGRWLFGEPPAAISELQLDYTIPEPHCTFITTSCPQPSCEGPPASPVPRPPEAGASPSGRMGGKCKTGCIAGCAVVVRATVL